MTANVTPARPDQAYGESASTYDDVLPLLVPHLAISRRAYHAAIRMAVRPGREKIVDIGCGTGVNIVDLLKNQRNLQYAGIDASDEMLERFARRTTRFSSRPRLIRADLIDRAAPTRRDIPQADLIVSSFFNNNFDLKIRERLYRLFAAHLTRGGALVLWDLYGSGRPQTDKELLNAEIAFIGDAFERRIRRLDAMEHDTSKLRSSRRYWLRHYRRDNYYPDISLQASPKNELALLQRCGFRYVECHYRYMMQAVLVCRR